jgi:ferrous iron transport protein A
MKLTIKDLKIGDEAQIEGYARSDITYRERLLSMGLTKGATIRLTKIAPLGDPVELEVMGYKLSLRKKEADILLLRRT